MAQTHTRHRDLETESAQRADSVKTGRKKSKAQCGNQIMRKIIKLHLFQVAMHKFKDSTDPVIKHPGKLRP